MAIVLVYHLHVHLRPQAFIRFQRRLHTSGIELHIVSLPPFSKKSELDARKQIFELLVDELFLNHWVR